MRLSLDAQKAVYAQESGVYEIYLFVMSHPNLTEDILLSSDATERIESLTTETEVIYGTVSNGQTFVYCPMDVELPSEDEDAPPEMKISISNVGRELIAQIRGMVASPSITMRMILSSNLNQIEGEVEGFTFTDIDINSLSVSSALKMNIFSSEPYPFRTFTPSTSSGLFK